MDELFLNVLNSPTNLVQEIEWKRMDIYARNMQKKKKSMESFSLLQCTAPRTGARQQEDHLASSFLLNESMY